MDNKNGGNFLKHSCATIVVKMASASMLRCLHNFNLKNVVFSFRTHWRYSKALNNESRGVKYLLVLDFEATCEDREKITQVRGFKFKWKFSG